MQNTMEHPEHSGEDKAGKPIEFTKLSEGPAEKAEKKLLQHCGQIEKDAKQAYDSFSNADKHYDSEAFRNLITEVEGRIHALNDILSPDEMKSLRTMDKYNPRSNKYHEVVSLIDEGAMELPHETTWSFKEDGTIDAESAT